MHTLNAAAGDVGQSPMHALRDPPGHPDGVGAGGAGGAGGLGCGDGGALTLPLFTSESLVSPPSADFNQHSFIFVTWVYPTHPEVCEHRSQHALGLLAVRAVLSRFCPLLFWPGFVLQVPGVGDGPGDGPGDGGDGGPDGGPGLLR